MYKPQFNFRAGSLFLLAFFVSLSVFSQQIKNLSGANTPQDDMNPVWIGDGVLLFTRANHFQNVGGINDPGDIWMTKKTPEGEWSEAIHRKDLSTAGYDLALGLEDILTLLVFHSGSDRFGVFQYSKFGQEWNFLRQVSMPEIEKFQGAITGSVSKGGKYIFLSGNRSDSRGNEDIYVSEKLGPVQWAAPKSLGSAINTPGQETSPYFDPSSGLLYFSSNLQLGAQGKDIFIAKVLSEDLTEWSAAQKWVQLSSPGSESAVTFISPTEVVWTTTQNSDGFADLVTYEEITPLEIPNEFKAPETVAVSQQNQSENVTTVTELAPLYPSSAVGMPEVKLMEKSIEMEEEPVRWLVIDQKNKIRVENFRLMAKSGEDWKEIPAQNQKISDLKASGVQLLRFEAAQFFPTSISLVELKTKEPNVILMTKAETGNSLLLDKVNFKRGTADLEEGDTFDFLDQIVGFLSENPDLKIRISGHTDSAGDPGLNKALSLDRAGAVRDYLVDQGVDFERLRISGWGGTRPIASNATEAGRSKNRRVELTIED